MPGGASRGASGARLWELSIKSARGHRGLGTTHVAAVKLAGGRVGDGIVVMEVRG